MGLLFPSYSPMEITQAIAKLIRLEQRHHTQLQVIKSYIQLPFAITYLVIGIIFSVILYIPSSWLIITTVDSLLIFSNIS